MKQDKVTITIEKDLIPSLLGALKLGGICESWCADLEQIRLNSYDTHSTKWLTGISHIIQSIKKQTGITTEDTEYGHEGTLEDIHKMVNKKSQYYKKNSII